MRRDDLLDLNVSYITHPDDLATETEQRRRLASADIGRYELVQRCLRKDRTSIWVHLSVSATRRNPSDASYFVAQLEILIAPGPGHHYPNLADHKHNVEYDINRVIGVKIPAIRGRFADQVPAREEVLPVGVGTLRIARQPAPDSDDCNPLQMSSSPDGDA